MRQLKLYGISSAVIITVIIFGLILYFVFNNVLVPFMVYLVSFVVFVLLYAVMPGLFRRMSDTVELRDTAISSRKTEIASHICNECKGTKALLEKVSGEVDTGGAMSELERLGQELASLKCCSPSFEVMGDELGGVDLTFLTTRSAEVRDRLGAVKRSVADRYAPILKKKASELDGGMRGLASAGFAVGDIYSKFEGVLSRDAKSLNEMIEEREELAALSKEALMDCLEEAKGIATAEAGRRGASEVTYALGKIHVDEGEFAETAGELAGLRKKLRGMMGNDFYAAKKSLTDSMESVLGVAEGEGLAELRAKVEGMANALKELDDPGKLGRLKESEREYREVVRKSLEELSTKIELLQEELENYKPPRELASKLPPKIEVPGGSLPEFTKKLASMLREVGPGTGELIRNVKIMRSYPKVERLIDARLEESRRVAARDLDVKYPELFFLLYKKKHPKAKFIEAPEPRLIMD